MQGLHETHMNPPWLIENVIAMVLLGNEMKHDQDQLEHMRYDQIMVDWYLCYYHCLLFLSLANQFLLGQEMVKQTDSQRNTQDKTLFNPNILMQENLKIKNERVGHNSGTHNHCTRPIGNASTYRYQTTTANIIKHSCNNLYTMKMPSDL